MSDRLIIHAVRNPDGSLTAVEDGQVYVPATPPALPEEVGYDEDESGRRRLYVVHGGVRFVEATPLADLAREMAEAILAWHDNGPDSSREYLEIEARWFRIVEKVRPLLAAAGGGAAQGIAQGIPRGGRTESTPCDPGPGEIPPKP